MHKYLYIAFSGGAGLVNMVSVFIAVSMLDAFDSDYLLLSLSFVNFCVILFGSPLNTGKLKFVQTEFSGNDIIAASDYIFFRLIRLTPLLIIILFSSYYVLTMLSDIRTNSYSNVIIVSLCSVITIIFEFCRIDRQIERDFLIISSSILFVNVVLLIYVLTFDFSLLLYFGLMTILRSFFVLFELIRRWKRYVNRSNTINTSGLLKRFFDMVRFYWFAVVVTALSGFLPGYFLTFFQSGYLTVYQLAYRIVVAPLSLVVTPFVDYIRYNAGKKKIPLQMYLNSLVTMMLFSIIIIFFCLFFSEYISSVLINDTYFQDLFKDTLILLSICLIPGSLYILNTRIAELGLPISTISIFGLCIHCFYMILIFIFSYSMNFKMFVISKLFVEFAMFLPISFYFLYKSKRILKLQKRDCNEN